MDDWIIISQTYPSVYEMQLCPFLLNQWMHALKTDLSADMQAENLGPRAMTER